MSYQLLTTPGGHGYLDGASTMPALVDGLHAIALQDDTVTAALAWWKGASGLGTSTDLDTLTSGVYTCWSTSTASTIGLPVGAVGTLWVSLFGSTGGTQIWYASTDPLQVWARVKYSAGWGDWIQQPYMSDVLAAIGSAVGAAQDSASGFKTVPLAVTLGRGGADAPTTGGYRIPLQWNAPITRWRLHMSTRNARFGTTRPAADISGIWIGPHDGAGAFTSAPSQVAPAFTLDQEEDYVSPWSNTPIGANAPMMLAYGYDAAAAPWSQTGGGWYVATSSTAGDLDPARSAATQAAFDIWIEAETYATTPVVAVVGDSLSAGVGATWPVHDSTISQWARTNAALPVHYAHSGDTMAASQDPKAYKWSRWDHLSRPDSVLFAFGSNDVFGGASLSTVQGLHASTLDIVRRAVSTTVYDTQLLPRTSVPDGPEEDIRRSYNTWLGGKRDGVRDYFAWVAAISSDDETINPAMDADGTHLNTSGYAALAADVTRPIVVPAA